MANCTACDAEGAVDVVSDHLYTSNLCDPCETRFLRALHALPQYLGDEAVPHIRQAWAQYQAFKRIKRTMARK